MTAATTTLRRPRYLIQVAIVNEDEGSTRWISIDCAHTERGAWTILRREYRKDIYDGWRVIDTTSPATN